MKKLLIVFIFLFAGLLFVSYGVQSALANPKCITFKVKVTAKNWPGGKLQIGCPGDRGPACVGEIKDIRVGQAKPVVLGKCSCFPSDNGCVVLGKKLVKEPLKNGKRKITIQTPIPPKCEYLSKKKFCGSNGQTKKPTFRLTCEKKPTPTPTGTPTPTPTTTISPTPTQCVGPKKVTNVKVTCPNCFSQQDLDEFFNSQEE